MKNNFSDFNITPTIAPGRFSGDKLQIDDIINREIEVLDFIIEDSTKKEGTMRLRLQFRLNEKIHIVFSGSKTMQDQIKKVAPEKIPFFTTIVKDSKHHKFT